MAQKTRRTCSLRRFAFDTSCRSRHNRRARYSPHTRPLRCTPCSSWRRTRHPTSKADSTALRSYKRLRCNHSCRQEHRCCWRPRPRPPHHHTVFPGNRQSFELQGLSPTATDPFRIRQQHTLLPSRDSLQRDNQRASCTSVHHRQLRPCLRHQHRLLRQCLQLQLCLQHHPCLQLQPCLRIQLCLQLQPCLRLQPCRRLQPSRCCCCCCCSNYLCRQIRHFRWEFGFDRPRR